VPLSTHGSMAMSSGGKAGTEANGGVFCRDLRRLRVAVKELDGQGRLQLEHVTHYTRAGSELGVEVGTATATGPLQSHLRCTCTCRASHHPLPLALRLAAYWRDHLRPGSTPYAVTFYTTCPCHSRCHYHYHSPLYHDHVFAVHEAVYTYLVDR